MGRDFLMLVTPLVRVVRVKEDVAMEMDYEEQARILCSILTVAVPSGVPRKFFELTGGDYEKMVDIGNQTISRALDKNQYRKKKGAKK